MIVAVLVPASRVCLLYLEYVVVPYIDLDKLFLNILSVCLWYPISFQSICADIFLFTLNLIAVSLKLVRIAVWLLLIPMLNTLHSLDRHKNVREQIKLSSICGDLV